MNWVTTNIRLPEDMYMDLKMEAARQRKSVAALIRHKISVKKGKKKTNIQKALRQMDKLAENIARQNPGLNLTKALIKMRYEQ